MGPLFRFGFAKGPVDRTIRTAKHRKTIQTFIALYGHMCIPIVGDFLSVLITPQVCLPILTSSKAYKSWMQ